MITKQQLIDIGFTSRDDVNFYYIFNDDLNNQIGIEVFQNSYIFYIETYDPIKGIWNENEIPLIDCYTLEYLKQQINNIKNLFKL